MSEAVANRVVRFRLLPGTPERANMLAQLAGAGRFVWNAALARNEKLWRARNEEFRQSNRWVDMMGWDGGKDAEKKFNRRFEDDGLKAAGWDGDPKTRKHFNNLVDREKFPKPEYSFYDLGKWFAAFRRSVRDENGEAWLMALPHLDVRAALKDLAGAYENAFKGVRGFPKFKSRFKGGQRAGGFWIEVPSLKDGALLIPQAQTPKGEPNRPPVRMKIRRRGKSPYDERPVKRARVVMDGKKWFVFLWHEVPEGFCEPPVRNREVVGIDLNTVKHGAALSAPIVLPDGEKIDKSVLPEKILRLEKRRRRYQRRMSRKADAALRAVGWDGKSQSRNICDGLLAKKHKAKIARRRESGEKPSKRAIRYGENKYGIRYAIDARKAAKAAAEMTGIRQNWAHQTARAAARTAEIVGLEDLKIQAMTRSAKGDAENPGIRVRQRAGLNAAILGAGWGALKKALEYKCGEVVEVNPRDTSRRCSKCGEINGALTLSARAWKCPKCKTAHDRDGNAAKNIAMIACAGAKTPDAILARGHGASARGGRPPPLNFGRHPPPNRRNSTGKRTPLNRRNSTGQRPEVLSPPLFFSGPSGAKREQ